VTKYIWLLPKVVKAIHARQIAEHGGQPGLRDEGLLESALARPIQMMSYGDPSPDIATLAAGYAYGLSRNHPFFDGNKRVAYIAARTFLILNGWDIDAEIAVKHTTMVALASGSLSEDDLADWIRRRIKRIRGR